PYRVSSGGQATIFHGAGDHENRMTEDLQWAFDRVSDSGRALEGLILLLQERCDPFESPAQGMIAQIASLVLNQLAETALHLVLRASGAREISTDQDLMRPRSILDWSEETADRFRRWESRQASSQRGRNPFPTTTQVQIAPRSHA